MKNSKAITKHQKATAHADARPAPLTNHHASPVTHAESYEASVSEQRREAVQADLAEINKLEVEIGADKLTVLEKATCIANAMWRQGQALQRLVGKTQITFGFFQQHQAALPAGWDFEVAKRRIAVTCRMESEITEWEQLNLETQKAIRDELQFVAVRELALAPLGSGSAGPTGVFTCLLNDLVKMKQVYLKATRAMPLEEQSRDRLQDFLNDTQWLAEERERASKLLLTKGSAQA